MNVEKLILYFSGLFLVVGGSRRWYLFVELEHCGYSNDFEKIHQVILSIREWKCREIYFIIFGAVFGGGRRWSEVLLFYL